MSRHRAVRNLDLAEELADDFDHDADFLGTLQLLTLDNISPEDQDALEHALLAVIDTLGEPEECGISERRMKEALWETYFDAPAAVDMLMEAKEQEEAQARKRAGTYLTLRHAAGRAASRPLTEDGFTDVGTSAKAPRLHHVCRTAPGPPPVADIPPTPRDSSPAPAVGSVASPVSSPHTASPASSAPKKLSKLQQKLQANREKMGTASGAGTGKGIARLLSPKPRKATTPRAASPAVATEPVTVAPSGAQLSTLFPRSHSLQPFSNFGRMLGGLACGQAAGAHISLPTKTDAEMEQLQAVFSQLSPDDVVQQARQGTRLAR